MISKTKDTIFLDLQSFMSNDVINTIKAEAVNFIKDLGKNAIDQILG
jgi:hypothetical protein